MRHWKELEGMEMSCEVLKGFGGIREGAVRNCKEG